ncbi:MAG TPA: tetratricopeptide repeat protein [Bryobacteraceae bacterium]|jgi:tetratricopeptide (TPR) repeat protein
MRLPVDISPSDDGFPELQALAQEKVPEDAPGMVDLGKRLYRALDGPARRLATLSPNATLELRFPTKPGQPAALAHLPWELLHDGDSFLVQRGIIPVRQISFGAQAPPAPPADPANRPLNVLFMACSPRDVQPVLNFESEERIILDATSRQPLYLTPEETGSIEELYETVRSYPPFDVFHLTGHGDLYDEAQYNRYLAPGQIIAQNRPILLTENESGFCLLQHAEDVERAFENRIPRLVFLSGCRTSELPRQNEQAHSSLAQDLLYRGFPSVMGWARPVFEISATVAAALLYQEISAGSTAEEALRHTLRELTRPGSNGEPFQIPDWHLLRLFTTQVYSTAALVTPKATLKRMPFEPPHLDEGFLDKEKKLKVAGFQRFVGRRRALQRTLPALASESDKTGVIVWGMGGLGKSSLAARLCDRVERRNHQLRRAVLVGELDEKVLLNLLRNKYKYHPARKALDEDLPLGGKLINFFRQINEAEPLLLVLDDFEQNIELNADAKDGFLLSRPAYDALEALGSAIHEAHAQSRLIVTTRYWSEGAFPDIHLLPEQLPQMDPAELRKKARREVPESEPEKTESLITSAAGNPRFFESLAKDGSAFTEDQFRQWLKLGEVLETLSLEERIQLARLSVFQLPVPPSMAEDVTGDSHFHRAVSLGLAELTEPAIADGEPQLAVAALVRPLLESALDDDHWRAAYSSAARAAHQSWWDREDRPSEMHVIEIIRLATLGGEREIACDLMQRLANVWNRRARFRDTARLAKFVLARFEDPRLLSFLAVAERTLGDTTAAAAHLDRARAIAPAGDSAEGAFALFEAAKLRAQQGDVSGAIALYNKSMEVSDRLNSPDAKAAILHQMASLRHRQGDWAGATELYRQSLQIHEQIGNVRGKAATLHQMAELKAEQGDFVGAMDLYQQSLDIEEQIGNAQGKAPTLHAMADLRAREGNLAEAMDLYRQSLDIHERIGSAHGKAATLAQLAALARKNQDTAGAMRYAKQAAKALSEVQAWPDLHLVVGNLSAYDLDSRLHWLAQAAWLALTLGNLTPGALTTVRALFHAIPAAHPLEFPLAVLAIILFANHGPEELQTRNREEALDLLNIAAHNQSLSEEAAIAMFQEKAKDPGALIRETLRALEALAPEPWIFDRDTVIASLTAGVRSSNQEESAESAAENQ